MIIGNESDINVSLTSVLHAWYSFKKGKTKNHEFDTFTYSLESNLHNLHQDLLSHTYQHGHYRTFYLTDTKKRTISVASIRDRIVHRLIYDYLVSIFDKRFIYDAWSCREGKGLLGAINRAGDLLKSFPNAYVWRCDITKFFDSIDQEFLKKTIRRRVSGERVLWLTDIVIDSFFSYAPGRGMPIGNLTSQIFCNIYMNELDHYVSHTIRPLAYMRYGDDFLLIIPDHESAKKTKEAVTLYITNELKLTVHKTNNIIIPTRQGIHFLGCDIYPNGRRLRKKMYPRIKKRLNLANLSSYRSLILTHDKEKDVKWIDWNIANIIESMV
ncbi:MAG TPA: reverse transcriptase/maturase family protein [Patescibacteria group bacterium]